MILNMIEIRAAKGGAALLPPTSFGGKSAAAPI